MPPKQFNQGGSNNPTNGRNLASLSWGPRFALNHTFWWGCHLTGFTGHGLFHLCCQTIDSPSFPSRLVGWFPTSLYAWLLMLGSILSECTPSTNNRTTGGIYPRISQTFQVEWWFSKVFHSYVNVNRRVGWLMFTTFAYPMTCENPSKWSRRPGTFYKLYGPMDLNITEIYHSHNCSFWFSW